MKYEIRVEGVLDQIQDLGLTGRPPSTTNERSSPLNYTPVISADRLTDIPTDELEYLAERFHELTVRMYEELCTRRTAEQGTAEVEAMLRAHDENTL